MSLRTKLLTAFAVVLAPVLLLLLLAFRATLQAERERALETQLLTAQAVAAQVDNALDAAIGLGWTVAETPIAQTMDPAVLDSHLRRVLRRHSQYDAINVFDAQGVNRGWGHATEPATPRLQIGDRDYFIEVMTTNRPVISKVIELRRPLRLGFVVSVPIRGPSGDPVGVVNVVARTDMLARGYSASALQEGQSILLTDRYGRLAFETHHPDLTAAASEALKGFAPLQRALAGEATVAADHDSPMHHDRRMGAFVPTARHAWVVGVTVPTQAALGPARESFWTQVIGWFAILVFSMALALALVRYLGGPVMRLEAHAHALGAGELHRRVDIKTGDELERLGTAFNQMAERLAQREAELKRAQAELVRRERLSAVGELAAVIAHEVRNPLGVIFNAVSALRRSAASTGDVVPLHDMLQEEADRLNRIVSDLLDFARPMKPTLDSGDLIKVLRDAMTVAVAFGAGSPVRIEEQIEEGLPPVTMDDRMIRQTLLNIGINAVQSMPAGGVLRIAAGHEVRGGRGGIRIDVTDQGVGIPEAVLGRIFEPFFTTKATGTGLGLAVVKRFVEEHEGEISIDTAPDRGTTFTLWFPESPSRAAQAGASMESSAS